MKTAFVTIALILIGIGAYYVFLNVREPQVEVIAPSEDTRTAVTTAGSVVLVNLDQMAFDGPALITILDVSGNEVVIAVPSMGLPQCAAVATIADVASVEAGDMVEVRGTTNEDGSITPCEDSTHYLNVTSRVENNVYGYTYVYTKGPQGYIRLEDNDDDAPAYVAGSILFDRAEYAAFQENDEGREGPMAIRIGVYENVNNLSASVWAMQHASITNIELAFEEPEEAVVGGANAVHFVADGLWPIDTYVVASGGYIYVLAGMYNAESDPIHAEFESIVQSFTFIPTIAQVSLGL